MGHGDATGADEEPDRVEGARSGSYWFSALAQAVARAGKEERDDTVLRPNGPGEAKEWGERQHAYGEEHRMRAIAANLRSGHRPPRRGVGPAAAPRRATAAARRRGHAV